MSASRYVFQIVSRPVGAVEINELAPKFDAILIYEVFHKVNFFSEAEKKSVVKNLPNYAYVYWEELSYRKRKAFLLLKMCDKV